MTGAIKDFFQGLEKGELKGKLVLLETLMEEEKSKGLEAVKQGETLEELKQVHNA